MNAIVAEQSFFFFLPKFYLSINFRLFKRNFVPVFRQILIYKLFVRNYSEKIYQSYIIFLIVSLKSIEFSKMDGISVCWSRARILSRATVYRIGRLRNAKGSARKTIGTLDQHTRNKKKRNVLCDTRTRFNWVWNGRCTYETRHGIVTRDGPICDTDSPSDRPSQLKS